MARTFGSWLSGPPVPEPATPGDAGYQGQRLGLPAQGTGSLVGFARRFFALLIDWLIAYGLGGLAVALGWFGQGALSTAVLAIWIVVGAVSVRLFGFTPGQVAVGIQVASVDHRMHVGIGRALVRGVLVALVIPPLFTDSDGRGLQDKATGTAVVRR